MSLIDDAKNKLGLFEYLCSVMGEPVSDSRSVRWDNCIVCGESEHASRKFRLSSDLKYFNCAKCGEHGDVLHAVALVNGCSSIEAARLILYGGLSYVMEQPKRIAKPDAENQATSECLKKIFELSHDLANMKAIRYLMGERCLTPNVLLSAKNHGILGFLPETPSESIKILADVCGKDLMVDAGFWRKDAKAPAIAFRQIIFFMPDLKSAEFRLARDSEKNEVKALRYGPVNLPWKLSGSNSSVVTITEGAIDMLSIPGINPKYQGDIIGLPGCGNWDASWFSDLKGKLVYTCLDNDSTDSKNRGQEWADKLSMELTKIGARVINKLPPGGAKDINIALQQCSKG